MDSFDSVRPSWTAENMEEYCLKYVNEFGIILRKIGGILTNCFSFETAIDSMDSVCYNAARKEVISIGN